LFSLMLAPLEGYTDSVLRTLCFRHGADMTFTEMAHVESFLRGNRQALEKIAVRDSTPVQIQLLTGKEEHLESFLGGFEPFPGFEGFNLNLSCPSPDVIRQGKGAAMIKRMAKTGRLVSIIHAHGHKASLKIRLGTNAYEKAQKVYLNSLGGVDANLFIVHAKTASQGSVEEDDYSVYPECVDAARGIPVIANGGIDSVEKVRRLRGMGVAGVMIGRAALTNPAIFDVFRNELGLNEAVKPVPSITALKAEYDTIHENLEGGEGYARDFHRVLGKRIGKENY
jgi:tRNA-dihydrouridine synthase B